MLRQAGFDQVRAYPVAAVTRGAVRRVLRATLRRLGVEDVIRPPTYCSLPRSEPVPLDES